MRARELPRRIVYLELLDSLLDADGGEGRARYRLARDFPWLFEEGWEIERWGLRRGRTGSSGAPGSLRGFAFTFPAFPRVLLPVVVWTTQFVQSVLRPRAGVLVAYSPVTATGAAAAMFPRQRSSVLVVRIISDFSARARLFYGRPKESRILRALERFALRRADLVLPISPFTHAIAREAGVSEERILDLPHPAPAFGVEAAPRRQGEPVRIAAAGRLVPDKGFDVLLLAFAELADEFPDVALGIAGDGPQRSSLETLAASVRIADRVRFHGWLGRQLMPGFFGAAQLAVLPSRTNEGFPMVLVEAGLAGCALVGSDVGGIRDIVHPDRTGVLVPPNDAGALAEALRALLRNPERAHHLGEGARAEARAFTGRRDEAVQRIRERVEALRTARGHKQHEE
jgi:glycosyltransferase involved in cell wall biosynthesis